MVQVLLRLPQVRERVALSRSEIYRRMALGEFPRQVSLGARAVAWPEDDINDWVTERIKEGRTKAAS
jgi:prophage regulatory protein